jgi:hypothetical protein
MVQMRGLVYAVRDGGGVLRLIDRLAVPMGTAVLAAAVGVAVNLATSEEHGYFAGYALVVVTAAAGLAGYFAEQARTSSGTLQVLAHARCVMLVVAGAAVLIAAPLSAARITGPACPGLCFEFENGAQGWAIRPEGDTLLGRQATVADGVDAGGWFDNHSLAFHFRLGTAPSDKAQVKVEGLKMEAEIAASVYVPQVMPSTLVVSAYVVEHNEPAASDRPEWVFYQTNPRALASGVWSRLRFTRDSFFIAGHYPPGQGSLPVGTVWPNPPLLLGFEIRDTAKGSVDGTVYLDQVSIR